MIPPLILAQRHTAGGDGGAVVVVLEPIIGLCGGFP